MKNRTVYKSGLAKSILLRCLLTTAAAIFIMIALAFLAQFIARLFVWYPTDPLYHILKIIENNIPMILTVMGAVTLYLIIFYYLSKTCGYIGQIAEASKSLVDPNDESIHLPPVLNDVENRMNKIKQAAVRNERAARDEVQRKNDLVVYLAHDIKTPLTSIIGYLSLIDEAPDMPSLQREKYVGITLEKAYRLDQLIDEFFDITRFNLQSIVINKAKINLSFMLNQIADEFYPLLAPQNKSAAVHIPENLVLWGDADKLSRVFNNILKNAIAYSYDNCAIEIEAYIEGENVVITFANQGDPIPHENLEMIFEKFFRLDTSRSSKTGGAGLGLAIAKEIVTAHGGTIAAESHREKTVFTITLPNTNTPAAQR